MLCWLLASSFLVLSSDSGLPALPQAVASLGAITHEGNLYIYGGHAGKTHSYDNQTILGTFHRLKLPDGKSWEKLASGPILQGMNLIGFEKAIYRIGGLQPRNAPGEPADNISLPDFARFDLETGKWEAMPPLPAARSSHDVVLVGSKIIVVGGWQSRGVGTKPVWHDTLLIFDLKAGDKSWRQIPQPFQRRALTAAVLGEKVYVMGGIDSDSGTHHRVELFDVATEKWSEGPSVPGSKHGFGPAATTVNNQIIINTSDGSVYRLTNGGKTWDLFHKLEKPRMVHRLVPYGKDVLVVGGAFGGNNFDELQVIKVPHNQ